MHAVVMEIYLPCDLQHNRHYDNLQSTMDSRYTIIDLCSLKTRSQLPNCFKIR